MPLTHLDGLGFLFIVQMLAVLVLSGEWTGVSSFAWFGRGRHTRTSSLSRTPTDSRVAGG